MGWDGPKNLSGSRLVDVLKAVGCVNGPIATLALDGFGSEMSAAKVAAHDWVLSTMTFDHRWLLEHADGGTKVIQHEVDRGIGLWFWNEDLIEPAYAATNAALAEKVRSVMAKPGD